MEICVRDDDLASKVKGLGCRVFRLQVLGPYFVFQVVFCLMKVLMFRI